MGLLKQLYAQEFGADNDLATADPESQQIQHAAEDLKARWLSFSNEFKLNSGDDFQAKYDVFAESLTRLPMDEQNRFVNYSSIDCERAVDLAEETANSDKMNTQEGLETAGQSSVVPAELLMEQIQIMSLMEQQIEKMKQDYAQQLTGC